LPINLDPERPAMPISHPPYYAAYLAKRIGRFATLGLAEDTWALNEGVTNERTFIQQTCEVDDERRRMFFTALQRLQRGALVCVFDATDRIQHMFWRYIDKDHPANPQVPASPYQHAIRDLYVRNDALVGEVMTHLHRDDVLMVISDHGFTSFRRGVNVNGWLRENGYLTLVDGADGSAEWLREVDWSRTRAYCVGLTGMFLNLKGREQEGIVHPDGEAAVLKAELIQKLSGLRDDDRADVGIREVFDVATLYSGPYIENGPDLLIGYNVGYRVSWNSARGVVAGPTFEDNLKAWSGDHCIDPRLVPGVFFCNKVVDSEDPALIDVAPTALRLFGIEPPAYMDGRAWSVRM
jgi:predicted AlkP superfamily phosphohydrolase/phosphomutase